MSVPTQEQMIELMNKAAIIAEIQCSIGVKDRWDPLILHYLSSHNLSINLLENEEAAIAYVITQQNIDIIPKMKSYINMAYIIAFIADICYHKIQNLQHILHKLMDISTDEYIVDALLILIDANGSEILDSFFWGQHFDRIQNYKTNIYFI